MTLRLNYYALLVLCCSSGIIRALALPTKLVERADVNSTRPLDLSVTTVSTEELSELAPYTQFARAAYCPSSIITGWMCGRE